MANEFARNIQDASINPAAFALNNGAGSTQSDVIDLGADTYKPDSIELQFSVPALNATMVPDSKTVNYIIETSTTSAFSAVAQTILNDQVAGASSAGVAAYSARVRIPSNSARYVRAKVTLGATTGDASSISGTLTARF